jgi:hypothetical protein
MSRKRKPRDQSSSRRRSLGTVHKRLAASLVAIFTILPGAIYVGDYIATHRGGHPHEAVRPRTDRVDQFRDQADLICDAHISGMRKIAVPYGDALKLEAKRTRKTVNLLRKLEPPPRLAGKYDRYIAAREDIADTRESYATLYGRADFKDSDQGAMLFSIQQSQAHASELAGELAFESCGSDAEVE